MSRLHLLTGIGSYITAPLWLLFLVSGIVIAFWERLVPPDYFPAGKALFPAWPVVDPVRAMWMFVGTMALLLIPKVLGCIAVLANAADRRGCGGTIRLLLGLLLETLLAGLLAPVVMLTQSIDVVSIVCGQDSGWHPQRREDGAARLRETARLYRRHTLLGLAMGIAAWMVAPSLALWMSPVVLGLTLAIPLVALTSRRYVTLGRLGILRIPEEVRPPPVLARAAALAREQALDRRRTVPMPGRLLHDPALFAAHRAMLPPPRDPWVDPLEIPLLTGRAVLEEAPNLSMAWSKMTNEEKAACLANGPALRVIAARASGDTPGRAAPAEAPEDDGTFTFTRPPDNTGPDGLERSGGSTMEHSNPWRNVP